MAKKAALESRIAILEERTALTEKIEATKRWLDTARTQAKGAEKKTSQAVNQNKFVSQLVLAYAGADTEAALNPDATTQNFVQIFISAMVALVGIIMAPVGMFVAGRNRKGFAEIADAARRSMGEIVRPSTPAAPGIIREVHHTEDPRGLQEFRAFQERFRNALNAKQVTA
jgi:hypothetical protein